LLLETAALVAEAMGGDVPAAAEGAVPDTRAAARRATPNLPRLAAARQAGRR
jgi:hypothetical protein